MNRLNVATGNVNGGHTTTNTINDIPVVHETNLTSCRSDNSDTSDNDPPQSLVESSSSSSSVVPPTALAPRPPRSDFLVSEHEDNDDPDPADDAEDSGSTIIVEEATSSVGVNDAESSSAEATAQPTEIPPEGDDIPAADDDESDYEYDYEDDDDGYTGFLVNPPAFGLTPAADPGRTASEATIVPQDTTHTHAALPRRRVDDNVVELDDQDDGVEERPVPTGVEPPCASVARAVAPPPPSSLSAASASAAMQRTGRWKEPSREAVSMSLRAENETTGGRRRLAADLYKIMMHDNQEAGFSISPKGEDRMDAWTIRLFKFDEDSNLHRDLRVLGLDHVELEMNFPGEYPFEPPFVRVVRPRFKRQTGFVMNGALCMELLTNEGWNPVNDIESVIVSIRSLLVVGDGRLQAVVDMPPQKQEALQEAASRRDEGEKGREEDGCSAGKRKREDDDGVDGTKKIGLGKVGKGKDEGDSSVDVGQYTTAEAKAAYSHLSNFHKKKGWSHWWAKKG